MQRRCNLAYSLLANVIVLGLTPLMVVVDAQAQIVFMSDRGLERLAVGDLRDGYRWGQSAKPD